MADSNGCSDYKNFVYRNKQQIENFVNDRDGKTLSFEIHNLASFISQQGFRRIALQFPDYLLSDSVFVTTELKRLGCQKSFILADSSYSSCCVDEVAAAHIQADVLVHFGNACLSRSPKDIPVKHIFGRQGVNFDQIRDNVTAKINEILCNTDVCLLYDVSLAHLEVVLDSFAKELCTKQFFHCKIIQNSVNTANDANCSLGRHIPINLKNWTQFTTFYIASSDKSPLLPLWLMTYPNCSTVVHYEINDEHLNLEYPISTIQLRRRLFLIEKVKDAKSVGIVCGAAGVAGQNEAVKRLRRLCRLNGKRVYQLAVGKINAPKLANFLSSGINVFVYVSCPFGVLLHTHGDYHSPVVSVFEAEFALNPQKLSSFSFTADFRHFLQSQILAEEERSEVTDMSLITGRLRQLGIQNDENSDRHVQIYSARENFGEGDWKGLGECFDCAEKEELAVPGRSGVAASYLSEPLQNSLSL